MVLLTLSGFVEWVSMTNIMAEDGRLLQILCLLLNNEHFQDGAAECLLQVIEIYKFLISFWSLISISIL